MDGLRSKACLGLDDINNNTKIHITSLCERKPPITVRFPQKGPACPCHHVWKQSLHPLCYKPVKETYPECWFLKYSRKIWDFTRQMLHWRHNERDGVSNHRCLDRLLSRLVRRRSKKTSISCVNVLCEGNAPGPVDSPHKGPVTQKMLPLITSPLYVIRSNRILYHAVFVVYPS